MCDLGLSIIKNGGLIMATLKETVNNMKEKISGETKQAVGKATNNEELELKGKVQSSSANFKKKVGNIKEDIAGKINNKIDEMEVKKEDKKNK